MNLREERQKEREIQSGVVTEEGQEEEEEEEDRLSVTEGDVRQELLLRIV